VEKVNKGFKTTKALSREFHEKNAGNKKKYETKRMKRPDFAGARGGKEKRKNTLPERTGTNPSGPKTTTIKEEELKEKKKMLTSAPTKQKRGWHTLGYKFSKETLGGKRMWG